MLPKQNPKKKGVKVLLLVNRLAHKLQKLSNIYYKFRPSVSLAKLELENEANRTMITTSNIRENV